MGTSRKTIGGLMFGVGGLASFLLLSLPLLLSLETWPPWGDLLLDSDGVAANARSTGRRRAVSGKSKGRGDTSWMLELRFEDGPHTGKTTRVYCVIDWGCPATAGESLAVEVSKQDPALARMKGHRFAVLPFGVASALTALGALAALGALVGLGLVASAGRSARR